MFGWIGIICVVFENSTFIPNHQHFVCSCKKNYVRINLFWNNSFKHDSLKKINTLVLFSITKWKDYFLSNDSFSLTVTSNLPRNFFERVRYCLVFFNDNWKNCCFFFNTFTVNSFLESQIHFSYRVIGMLQNYPLNEQNIVCACIYNGELKLTFYIFIL